MRGMKSRNSGRKTDGGLCAIKGEGKERNLVGTDDATGQQQQEWPEIGTPDSLCKQHELAIAVRIAIRLHLLLVFLLPHVQSPFPMIAAQSRCP